MTNAMTKASAASSALVALIALTSVTSVTSLSACSGSAPDVEQLTQKLTSAGMKVAPDPAPLPPGVSVSDLQDIARATGTHLEYLLIDGARAMVFRFKSEAAAQEFDEHARMKQANEPKSHVPQYKPTQAEGRVKNFMITLSPGAGEDEAALRALLAKIENALAER